MSAHFILGRIPAAVKQNTNTAKRQKCFLNHASSSLILHVEKERESLQRVKKVWECDFGYHKIWQTFAFNFSKFRINGLRSDIKLSKESSV